MNGKFQIYTGEGKGKTTASMGLALRAAGAGFKVAFIQFDKGYTNQEHYAERHSLRIIPNIDLFPTGCERIQKDGKFRFGVLPEDRAEAERALGIVRRVIAEKRHQVVILDEINVALHIGLVTMEEVMAIVDAHAADPSFELLMTGRYAKPEVMERADLVTEMTKVKHYFDRGLFARRGIEF
jgi:cob(I)alamin adenosyltransferase